MIDEAAVERMFKESKEGGFVVDWRLYDKRAAYSLEDVPKALREYEIETTVDGLRDMAAAGWFPLRYEVDHGIEVVPRYTPSRIAMLLELQRAGWQADELRWVAKLEEWTIDNILTTDGLEYIDDPFDFFLAFTKDRIESLKFSTTTRNGVAVDPRAELAELEEQLAWLEQVEVFEDRDVVGQQLEKLVFTLRAYHESVRQFLLERDRAKLRAGYSAVVEFRRILHSTNRGFSVEGLLWEATIRSALAHSEEGAPPPIRIPGFVLRGDLIQPVKTFRPAEYATAWKEHDLDTYLKVWSRLNGERCCGNCYKPMAADASPLRYYCDEKCRNAAKQRRFREQNPASVERAQQRYWTSLNMDEE